ncbi:hypothetical protein Tco_0902114, partial [Tanacetum coccineum]
MLAFIEKETRESVDENIIKSLIKMMDQHSAVAKAFRMYNAPTVSEVAALIVNDFGDGLPTRYVIVNNKDNGP